MSEWTPDRIESAGAQFDINVIGRTRSPQTVSLTTVYVDFAYTALTVELKQEEAVALANALLAAARECREAEAFARAGL